MKKEVMELVKILKSENLTKVAYTKKDKEKNLEIKICVEKQINIPQKQVVTESNSFLTNETNQEIHGTQIKAPIVGTFYEAPGIGKKPFVKKGQQVKKGETLFILEAMKVMNEIKAPHDGKIVAIYVKNEQLVEYDQTIMVIE